MQSAMWQNSFVSRERRFRWAALQSQDILFAACGMVLIGGRRGFRFLKYSEVEIEE